MTTKTKTTGSTIEISPLYHDFEPYCEWKRGEDMLIVYVPEFKKEHLRVQVNTSGALKICGERPLEGDRAAMRSRFYKETRVPEGCNINDINAKLSDGKLTIVMPRNPPSIFPSGVLPPSSTDPSPQLPEPAMTATQHDLRALVPQKPSTSAADQRKPLSSVLDKVAGKLHVHDKKDEMIGFGGFKVAKSIVVNVGIAVVAIAAIGALVFLKPETTPNPSSASSSASSSCIWTARAFALSSWLHLPAWANCNR